MWDPLPSTSGKKNKTLRHENKSQGLETLGTGPWRQSLQNSKLHNVAEVFFQRKPKIESRQKSEGPPRWFDSSLFGGELSVIGPSLRVPGRRPQDSFPLPVKLFRSWDIHLQPLPTPPADVSQSKTTISSCHTVGLLCACTVPGLALWLQRRAS